MQEKRNKMVSIMITETMRKQLENLAEAREWTISQTAYIIIRDYLASQENGPHT